MSQRFEELDGLRGVAALSVFFSHAFHMPANDPVAAVNGTLLHILWEGTAAVFLFFILSGFVLALPYVGKERRDVDYPPYLVRRVFRIFPAYLFAVFFSLILMQFLFQPQGLNGLHPWIQSFWRSEVSLDEIIRHVTMIGPDTNKIDPPIWTLRIEFMISVVFMLIIYALQGKSRITSFAIALGFAALFIAKPSAFFYFSLFIAGGILARFHATLIQAIKRFPKPAILLLLLASMTLYTSRYMFDAVGANEQLWHFLVSTGGAMLIVMAITCEPFTVFLRSKPIKFLGDISYSFYLLHFPILLSVSSLIYPATGSLFLAWIISLLLSFASSWLVFKLIERPFQQLGRRIAKWPLFALRINYGKT